MRRLQKAVAVFVLILISGAWFGSPLFSEAESRVYSDEALSQKLMSLEKKVEKIQQNQRLISKKQGEIKSELASLRIWINKRR